MKVRTVQWLQINVYVKVRWYFFFFGALCQPSSLISLSYYLFQIILFLFYYSILFILFILFYFIFILFFYFRLWLMLHPRVKAVPSPLKICLLSRTNRTWRRNLGMRIVGVATIKFVYIISNSSAENYKSQYIFYRCVTCV